MFQTFVFLGFDSNRKNRTFQTWVFYMKKFLSQANVLFLDPCVSYNYLQRRVSQIRKLYFFSKVKIRKIRQSLENFTWSSAQDFPQFWEKLKMRKFGMTTFG